LIPKEHETRKGETMNRNSASEKCRNNRRTSRVRMDTRQRECLHFESLEERRLLAVDYDPAADRLIITGTSAADVVEVAHVSEPGTSYTSVRDNGVTYRFPESTMPVRSITANLYGGSDFFGLYHDSAIVAVDVWEHGFVDTGGGNDIVDVDIRQGNSNTDLELGLEIRTGGGEDAVRGFYQLKDLRSFLIRVDTGNMYDLVDIQAEVSIETLEIAHEGLLVNTGAGNDDIQISHRVLVDEDGSGATLVSDTNILAGDGDDLLRMDSQVTGGQADGFLLQLNDRIRLGNGHDRAMIDQVFSSGLDENSAIMLDVDGGGGNDWIDYRFIATLAEENQGQFLCKIRGGDGDDVIQANALLSPPQLRLQIDVMGNAGNDHLTLTASTYGRSLPPLRLRIDGGAGFDHSWSSDGVQVVNVEQQH
jgi:hypothetical protein